MIYEFRVYDADDRPTDEIIEIQCKIADRPDTITSTSGRIAKRIISVTAKMSNQWSSACGTQYGVNGYFNRGLGCYVHSDKEAEQIAVSKGLTRLSDISDNPHYIEDQMQEQDNEYIQGERDYAEMKATYETWGIS